MKTALTKKTTFLASLLVVAGAWTIQSCSGDDGSQGPAGPAGPAGTGACSISQDNRTVTCGDQTITVPSQGSGSGSGCAIMPDTKNGVPGMSIRCDGSANDAFIPSVFTADGVDCKAVVANPEIMNGGTGTGVFSGSAQFEINCGGNNTAKVGICDDLFYDALMYKCNASDEIELATGTCGGQIYYMGQEFCRGTATEGVKMILCGTSEASTDDGVNAQINAGTANRGAYGTNEFCWNQKTENGKLVPGSGTIKAKCATAQGNEEYGVSQFCQGQAIPTISGNPATVTWPAGTVFKIMPRCGYFEGKGDMKVGAQAGSEFYISSFCQKGKGVDEEAQIIASIPRPFCGFQGTGTNITNAGLSYTNEEECATNGEITSPCGGVGYTKNYFFCYNNTTVYARCGDTLSAANAGSNPGEFVGGNTAASQFCSSYDFARPDQYSRANEQGVKTAVCGKKYVRTSTSTPYSFQFTYLDTLIGGAGTTGQSRITATIKTINPDEIEKRGNPNATPAVDPVPADLDSVINVGYSAIEFCENGIVWKKCGKSGTDANSDVTKFKEYNTANFTCDYDTGNLLGKCNTADGEKTFFTQSQACTNNAIVMSCNNIQKPMGDGWVCTANTANGNNGYEQCDEPANPGSSNTSDTYPNPTFTACIHN